MYWNKWIYGFLIRNKIQVELDSYKSNYSSSCAAEPKNIGDVEVDGVVLRLGGVVVVELGGVLLVDDGVVDLKAITI